MRSPLPLVSGKQDREMERPQVTTPDADAGSHSTTRARGLAAITLVPPWISAHALTYAPTLELNLIGVTEWFSSWGVPTLPAGSLKAA